jgi:hypothetical protein
MDHVIKIGSVVIAIVAVAYICAIGGIPRMPLWYAVLLLIVLLWGLLPMTLIEWYERHFHD